MLPKPIHSKYVKGQEDHVDAWLMSYADFITLLFMFFIIFISITYARVIQNTEVTHEPPEYSVLEPSSGPIKLKSPFHETDQFLRGMIKANAADQDIAVNGTARRLQIDLSIPRCFQPGTAELRVESLPLLAQLAMILQNVPDGTFIEIAAHSDDQPLPNGPYADNWELTSMQAARIVQFLAQAGVDPAMLHASGYAASQPAAPNTDIKGNPLPINRARNQRIVITLEDPTTQRLHEASSAEQADAAPTAVLAQ